MVVSGWTDGWMDVAWVSGHLGIYLPVGRRGLGGGLDGG